MTDKQMRLTENLMAVKRQGVNFGNMSVAINVLIDAVAYLVTNTPEIPK